MKISHNSKESIRTVAAVIADIMAILSVVLQSAALYFIIKYHPR